MRVVSISFGKLFKLFVLGGAEQVVSSGANFLFLSIISRSIGLQQFGLYNVIWSGVMLAEGVVASLYGDTGVALIQKVPLRLRGRFRSAHYLLSLCLTAALLATCLVAAGIMPRYAGVLVLSGVSALALRMQQSFRRFCYWDGRRGLALAGAIVSAATLLTGFVLVRGLLVRAIPVHGASVALFVTAAGYLSAGGLLLALRSEFQWPDLVMLRWCWGRAFESGRWLLMATFFYWISTGGVIWIAASTAGAAAAAILRILMVLSNPLSQMGALSSTILLPIAARNLVDAKGYSVARVAAAPILAFSVIAAAYVVVLALIGLPVIHAFFPAKLSNVSRLYLVLIALAAAFDMIETAVTLPQVAMNRTGGFLLARMSSAATLMLGAVLLAPRLGLVGLLLSMVAANLVQVVAAGISLVRLATSRHHRIGAMQRHG